MFFLKSFIHGFLFFIFCFSLSFNLGYTQLIHDSLKEIRGIYKNAKPIVADKPIVYDNGILFTYVGNKNDEVYLSGSFFEWKKKVRMKSNSNGLFYFFLRHPAKIGTYTYRFLVNKLWVNDEQQPYYKTDTDGEQISYFNLHKNILFNILETPQKIDDYTYRFYLKDKNYKSVHFIGNFNYWDPTSHPMKLVNGYWFFDKKINFSRIFYSFWVDGKMMLDPLNFHKSNNEFGFTINFFDYKK